jgi:predicted membrane-bound dolichyl-phosphate-mannose-protein mannosyltransferase
MVRNRPDMSYANILRGRWNWLAWAILVLCAIVYMVIYGFVVMYFYERIGPIGTAILTAAFAYGGRYLFQLGMVARQRFDRRGQ